MQLVRLFVNLDKDKFLSRLVLLISSVVVLIHRSENNFHAETISLARSVFNFNAKELRRQLILLKFSNPKIRSDAQSNIWFGSKSIDLGKRKPAYPKTLATGCLAKQETELQPIHLKGTPNFNIEITNVDS